MPARVRRDEPSRLAVIWSFTVASATSILAESGCWRKDIDRTRHPWLLEEAANANRPLGIRDTMFDCDTP